MDPGQKDSCNAYYEAKVAKGKKSRSTVKPDTTVREGGPPAASARAPARTAGVALESLLAPPVPTARPPHSALPPTLQKPEWSWELKEFYDVPSEEVLRIKFVSQNALTADETIGRVLLPLAKVREGCHRGQRGAICEEFELEEADSGRVTIECLFVSYF